MFTGIIKALGKVSGVEKKNGALTLSVLPPASWQKVKDGQSIAINGVCLTVAKTAKNNTAVFFCQKETLDVSSLSFLKTGDLVNLEHAMKMSDELGGHIVQGHVDTTGICDKVERIGDSWRFWVRLPVKRPPGIVLKGSIALDGISLTISRLNKDRLSVDIIPFTYENTNIQFWKAGSVINIETDVIGKYVEKYMKALKK